MRFAKPAGLSAGGLLLSIGLLFGPRIAATATNAAAAVTGPAASQPANQADQNPLDKLNLNQQQRLDLRSIVQKVREGLADKPADLAARQAAWRDAFKKVFRDVLTDDQLVQLVLDLAGGDGQKLEAAAATVADGVAPAGPSLIGAWSAPTKEDGKLKITFKANGTVSYSFSGGDKDSGEGVFQIDGGSIHYTENGGTGLEAVDWAFSIGADGKLKLKMEDGDEEFVLTRLP